MTNLESDFYTQLQAAGLPLPIREYHAIDGRKYRWDFAWPDKRLLVELQGGTWSRTRTGHSTGSGIRRDCEKHNLAVLNGWKCLSFTADMVQDGSALQATEKAIAVDKPCKEPK